MVMSVNIRYELKGETLECDVVLQRAIVSLGTPSALITP